MDNFDNLSAVLYKKQDLRLEQRPVLEPNDNEVQLAISCVGICGSDVYYFLNVRIAQFVVEQPLILGHEASGVVTKVGKNVKTLKPGDRVAIEPGYGCRICSYCKGGRYNLCPDMASSGTPPYDGFLTRYACHPADCCFKLPDHVSLEEGAMLEPLSVGVHACRTSGITLGDRVLVLGAGTIGLVTLMAAQAMGAIKTISTDILDYKLEKAKELGAGHVINTKDFKEDDLMEHIKQLFDGDFPNKVIDCVGTQATVHLGTRVTRRGGILCVIGLANPEVTIPLTSALRRGIEMRGIFRYCNDYPIALEMVASGKAHVKSLITHHYMLEETLEAVETTRTGRGNAIKVMIHCDPKCKK